MRSNRSERISKKDTWWKRNNWERLLSLINNIRKMKYRKLYPWEKKKSGDNSGSKWRRKARFWSRRPKYALNNGLYRSHVWHLKVMSYNWRRHLANKVTIKINKRMLINYNNLLFKKKSMRRTQIANQTMVAKIK